MFTPRTAAFQRGQWGLIASLVTVALLIGISAWYYAKMLKPAAGSKNGTPAAEQAAYGVACTSYVSQMNQAASMYKSDNGKPPTSFDDLKKYGVTSEMYQTPGCQFQLDASTGDVTDTGKGKAEIGVSPIVVNSAPPAGASNKAPLVLGGVNPTPAPAPGGMQVGPGGIKVPTSGGSEVPGGQGSE